MNRTPWQMWDQATGEPAEGAGTLEAQAALEAALDNDPEAMRHPGILHLYVHLMEMSPFPEKALKAGDALRELVPDAGHLIHMPTHIDIQCGHYRDVFHWNWRATRVDRKALDRMGVYTVYTGYRLHNYHFAVYGAMFLGQFAPAWAAARELVAVTPEELLRVPSPPFADFFESHMAIWVHVLIRFGRWRQIIDEPLPEDAELYANLTATLLYAKGIAHAARGEVVEAEAGKVAVPRRPRPGAGNAAHAQRALPRAAGGGGGDARRRDRVSKGRLRSRVRATARRGRAGGCAALRRALGLDAADPPCAWARFCSNRAASTRPRRCTAKTSGWAAV